MKEFGSYWSTGLNIFPLHFMHFLFALRSLAEHLSVPGFVPVTKISMDSSP